MTSISSHAVVAAVVATLISTTAGSQEVPPPPLINAEGKVIKPAEPTPPPPPATQPAQPAPATEPEKVKVTAPPPEQAPAAAASAPLSNSVSLDIARLFDLFHGVVPAAGLAYERRLMEHVGVTVGLRIPFTFTSGPAAETIANGVTFTDTAYPWLLLGARYQFNGPDFTGFFLAGEIGITGMTSMWQAANPNVNIPRVNPNSPVSDCTAAGATVHSYCLTAGGGAVIANGGYSHVFFGHLLLEATLGIEIGFGGTEVNWIGADGSSHYVHDFRPPVSMDLGLVVGYAF